MALIHQLVKLATSLVNFTLQAIVYAIVKMSHKKEALLHKKDYKQFFYWESLERMRLKSQHFHLSRLQEII